jgi:hypothetical protein
MYTDPAGRDTPAALIARLANPTCCLFTYLQYPQHHSSI